MVTRTFPQRYSQKFSIISVHISPGTVFREKSRGQKSYCPQKYIEHMERIKLYDDDTEKKKGDERETLKK